VEVISTMTSGEGRATGTSTIKGWDEQPYELRWSRPD
jgi:hypothetical protein